MPQLRLVQYPQRSPTKCLLCHSGGGPFIDCDTEILGYGWVYLCAPNEQSSGCVAQMANLFGMLNPADRMRLEEELNHAQKSIRELEETVAALEKVKEVQAILNKRQERIVRTPVKKTPVKEKEPA